MSLSVSIFSEDYKLYLPCPPCVKDIAFCNKNNESIRTHLKDTLLGGERGGKLHDDIILQGTADTDRKWGPWLSHT